MGENGAFSTVGIYLHPDAAVEISIFCARSIRYTMERRSRACATSFTHVVDVHAENTREGGADPGPVSARGAMQRPVACSDAPDYVTTNTRLDETFPDPYSDPQTDQKRELEIKKRAGRRSPPGREIDQVPSAPNKNRHPPPRTAAMTPISSSDAWHRYVAEMHRIEIFSYH